MPSIEYKQLQKLVPLGRGHNKADEDRIRQGASDWKHEGKISVMMDRAQQKLIMHVDPNRPQTGDRLELEDAVRKAVESMTINIREWGVEFVWPNIE